MTDWRWALHSDKKSHEGLRFELDKLKSAILITTYPSGGSRLGVEDLIAELESLAVTYGLVTRRKLFCPIKEYSAATFIGKGKAEEIAEICEAEKIDLVIFDDEVSPNQEKNLEEIIRRPVLTRSALILEVFHQRAKTKEAMLQVELAQSEYQLPRLKRMWTHLSRQRMSGSGRGPLRGEGEKQIELDRRIIKERVSTLKREIKQVAKQRGVERKARKKSAIPTFAIVGYTNAGKSTLLNRLTDAHVYVEDKLFATLDTTARRFTLPNHQQIILIDTVGFIRKLPHLLIAAFKSTLEESIYTDSLLHIVDASDPKAEIYIQETEKVLHELGVVDKPVIFVFNKCDRVENPIHLKRLSSLYPNSVFISAKDGTGFDSLFIMMEKEVQRLRQVVDLRIPQEKYALVHAVLQEGRVIQMEYEENDILMRVEIPTALEKKLAPFYVTREVETE
ncbi:MAG: GTPase HflX [Chlamydiae bacterium RIFCSPHIGHO2_12_FULL_49_11]|nr:MAG: GTPase HflX [Chlamydiae bacterium RIFCSPHIGHO2_12_FULL_49_11]